MGNDFLEKVLIQLKSTQLFKFVDDATMKRLLEAGEVVRFNNQETIIREGETQPELFIIISGCVNVTVSETDKEAYICTIGEGEIFGEAGIFSKVRRTANVISVDETVILRLPRNNLLGFIKKNPAGGIKILMIIIYSLLKKLREINQELAFERKFDVEQDDIDAMIQGLIDEG